MVYNGHSDLHKLRVHQSMPGMMLNPNGSSNNMPLVN